MEGGGSGGNLPFVGLSKCPQQQEPDRGKAVNLGTRTITCCLLEAGLRLNPNSWVRDEGIPDSMPTMAPRT